MLTAMIPPAGYVTGEATTDLRCIVSGGQPPYSCRMFGGPGEGTMPIGVSQAAADASGCTLTGGVDVGAGDQNGVYGFIMEVEDANSDVVEIPVAYVGPSCDTSAATLTPSSTNVAVNAPGTAASWQLVVDDVDGVDDGMSCAPCFNLSLLTRSPLVIALGLDCANAGDLCSDCGAGCITGSCPGQHTLTRSVDLNAHSNLRTGAAAWATIELGATYSGSSLDPCGDKTWSCHLEVLEVAP